LRRHDRTIALRPNSRFVLRGHLIVSLLRPPPPTPPHKGEGSTPSVPLEIIHLNTLPAVTSRNAGGLRSRRRSARFASAATGLFCRTGGRNRTVNKYIRFYRGFTGFHEIRTYPQGLKLSSNCHGAIIER
jgi:hypothetical protein